MRYALEQWSTCARATMALSGSVEWRRVSLAAAVLNSLCESPFVLSDCPLRRKVVLQRNHRGWTWLEAPQPPLFTLAAVNGATRRRHAALRTPRRTAHPGTATLIASAVSPSTRGHKYALAAVHIATRCRTCRAAILVRLTDIFAWIPRCLQLSMR